MLVLSRKPGERVMIGPDIELIVVEVRGDRVRLGFRAPDQVSIYREEVYRRIEQENAGRPTPERELELLLPTPAAG